MLNKEFLDWQEETFKAIELWTIRLKNEALKQDTYKGAINYLDINYPSPICTHEGSPSEQFQSVIRSMFDEAKKMVYDEAQSQEIKHVRIKNLSKRFNSTHN